MNLIPPDKTAQRINMTEKHSIIPLFNKATVNVKVVFDSNICVLVPVYCLPVAIISLTYISEELETAILVYTVIAF